VFDKKQENIARNCESNRKLFWKFFITNNLFSSYQYGFIKGRSTVLQLLHILDEWSKQLKEGRQVDFIYTGFEKAYDKVPRKRLLSKLRSYGVGEDLIKWINGF